MTMENFIRDALYKPDDYISYHVGRELSELHPGKTVLEGQTWDFDLAQAELLRRQMNLKQNKKKKKGLLSGSWRKSRH